MNANNQISVSGRSQSKNVLELIRRRWRWLATSVCAFTGLFVISYYIITPTYRATALLMPVSFERGQMSGALDSTLGQLGGFASLAGISLRTDDSSTEEALAVLSSREFTEKFIDDLNLMPELFPNKWDKSRGTWRGSVRDWPTKNQACEYFDRKIRKVIRDKKTGLITLQIDWRNRIVAARWANELVVRLNSEMRNRAIRRADASIGFLKDALQKTTAIEVRMAINRLIETEIKSRMLADVNHEYAFRVIDAAVAPDANMPIWPKKMFFFIAGPVMGLLVGMICVISTELINKWSHPDLPE